MLLHALPLAVELMPAKGLAKLLLLPQPPCHLLHLPS